MTTNANTIEYPYCQDVSKYEKLNGIGKGTFGEVYKARCSKTGKYVALKKFVAENSNYGVYLPITTLREIKLLSVLRHENIITLIEVCRHEFTKKDEPYTEFYLVLEFCDFELSSLLANKRVKFSIGEKKKLLKMMFNGLHFIHFNKIIHRDIKASNILINKMGVLKLADFGLARPIHTSPLEENAKDPRRHYTNNVVTLWYRAPELLLGDRMYGPPIDIWSAACVMIELWTRSAFLRGDTEIKQLNLIIDLCGSITTTVWPTVNKLQIFNNLKLSQDVPSSLKRRIMQIVNNNNETVDLLSKMFTLDPFKRLNSEQILEHDFFWTPPVPSENLHSAISLAAAFIHEQPPNSFEINAIKIAKAQSSKTVNETCMYPSRIF
ncbi:hypothetical protein HZS_5041 [Henneguya salminicola]|nr:hypothetical protein HZS_5041 [Henneguya salminicola]